MEDPSDPKLSDPERLKALAETGLMDEGPVETLDRYVRLVRNTIGAPVALVSLVDDHRQFFSSAEGLPEPWASRRETPLTHSFCQYVVTDEDALVVDDALAHPRVKDNPAIRDLMVMAYAGMPIRTTEGYVLGSFCAVDSEPRKWSERELAVLRDLAHGVSVEMELRRRATRAEENGRRVGRLNAALIRAHDEATASARGALHDLATPLGVLGLGVSHLRTLEPLREHPEADELLETMRRSADHAMALIEGIRGTAPLEGLVDADTSLDLRTVIDQVCADLRTAEGPALAAAVEGSPRVAVHGTAMRRCLENLVSNAIRFADGVVRVQASVLGDDVRLRVEDDGPGLPEEATRDVWTAGARYHRADGRSGTGLGLAIVREIVERHDGTVRAGRSELGGAAFELRLPRAD